MNILPWGGPTARAAAMANAVIALVPEALGPYLAVITGVLSLPFTFFISNDAFYYGVVPILSQAAAEYGICAAELAGPLSWASRCISSARLCLRPTCSWACAESNSGTTNASH